jgi:hypothetical protein
MTKCIEVCTAAAGRTTARGAQTVAVGCYGNPRRIADRLARALNRLLCTPGDVLEVSWRTDASTARDHCRKIAPRAAVLEHQATRRRLRPAVVTGFYIGRVQGRLRLQIRIREGGK